MTLRVVFRSLVSRPVRTAVLVCGFGFGIAVMAALLGVGEVIVEQARSPALAGGGDVVVSGGSGAVTSARFVLGSVLGAPPFAGRVAGASPSSTATLYLVHDGGTTPVHVRAGVPSLEKAIGDPETAGVDAWVDVPADRDWTAPDPGDVLRAMNRFHPVPDVPARADSWAEWLYFNGRGEDFRFYASFIFGPRTGSGRRSAVARLQLERDGRTVEYSDRAEVSDAELLASAPDVAVGRSSVRLEGTTFRITLGLYRVGATSRAGRKGSPDLAGEITLDASAARSVPPITFRGAGGWVSGYVVPVLSGPLGGALSVEGTTLSLEGGTGYHDHNWGFWEGVSWQWGQVASAGVSIVWGRVRPPADAADPERIPGFLGVLGGEGVLGFSTDVRIEETDDPGTARPSRILIRARGRSVDLETEFSVENVIRTPLAGGPLAGELDFLQMRGVYRVSGRAGDAEISFTERGAAETFRGAGRPG